MSGYATPRMVLVPEDMVPALIAENFALKKAREAVIEECALAAKNYRGTTSDACQGHVTRTREGIVEAIRALAAPLPRYTGEEMSVLEIGCPIGTVDLQRIIKALGDIGRNDIEWAETLDLPDSAEEFAWETIYVICNSGMKNTIARQIYERVREAILAGGSSSAAFGNKNKCRAIDKVWAERVVLFNGFISSNDRLAYLEALPHIGPITKYHLAKNFGEDVAKPDVHLQRLADRERCTPQALCERLATATGYRIATVDTLLWRACANGIIDPRPT